MRDEQITELLLAARRNGGELLKELPASIRPRDWDEVRKAQDLQMKRLGPVGGYKVGAAGPEAPISFAPLPASGIVESGATLVGWHQRWVEAEIAVRFARDLPRREVPYSPEEVQEAIGSVHPVIEVLNSRFRDVSKIDALSLGADLIMHGGLVVGAAVPMPDLADETVSVLIDGVEASRGKGHPAGDMVRLLRYLADEVGIVAGQIVTTGSWNPVTVPPEDCTVVVRFAHAGEVSVRFQAA